MSPGELLDRKFRIERVIGTGGMGVVLTARHIDLGQRVAIKFMLPQAAADPTNAERFAREARAAVQLRSQHVGRVLDVGVKGNAPYMVMEFLEGQDLDDVVRVRGALPYPVAVNYVLQACEAIAEAHALGIVHRDLKPKNLFLTQTPSGDACVKVLDFGLAKMGNREELNASLTTTGSVFGTPQYMSPEQMRSSKDVDGASDIWALGVTLYELVTAVVPFTGATLPEVWAAVLKEAPRPPSELAPQIPDQLERVVLRCLEKEPSLRFANVIELAFALQPFTAEVGLAAKAAHVASAAARRSVETVTEPAKRQAVEDKTVGVRVTRVRSTWAGAAVLISILGYALAVARPVGSDRRLPSSANTVTSSQPPVAAPIVSATAPADGPPPSLAATNDPPSSRPPAASRSIRRRVPPLSSGPAPSPSATGPLMGSP